MLSIVTIAHNKKKCCVLLVKVVTFLDTSFWNAHKINERSPFSPIAQGLEHLTHNQGVLGSNPSGTKLPFDSRISKGDIFDLRASNCFGHI